MSFAVAPDDFMKGIVSSIVSSPKPQVIEFVECAKCHRMYTWDDIRKLLDSRGEFVQYRCHGCVSAGETIE